MNKEVDRKRVIFFGLILFVLFFIGHYINLNLFSTGHWQLDLIQHQDELRNAEPVEVFSGKDDRFAEKVYSNKASLIQDMSLYSYHNFPAYLLYKSFNLGGVKLWLGQKLIMFFLGICVILLIFLISNLFYGSRIGLLAASFIAFSPHVWIIFNFDGAIQRGYNFLLSLLVIYLFLLFFKYKKWYFSLFSGIIMGVNFLVFHIGSFMIPLVIFSFCIYKAFRGKEKSYYLKHLVFILIIAIFSGFIINYLHCNYFNLPLSTPLAWIKGYIAKGPEASHTVSGIVLFDLKRLLFNVWEHINGVFVNGITSQDWHYVISPPGIPYIYNYLMPLFFVIGLIVAVKERKDYDVFFLLWFVIFFFIYSFVIIVRQKNILWEIPAIFILSARAISPVGSFLYFRRQSILKNKLGKKVIDKINSITFIKAFLDNKVKINSEKGLINFITGVLVISSMLIGSFLIFIHLPQKNFYDGGGYMGNYQAYKYIRKKGYTNNTKIIFTLPEVLVGNMMMRLFTEKVPRIICLSQYGLEHTSKLEDWKKFESDLLQKSDKIYYCFNYYDNHKGRIYITDNYCKDTFVKLHPELKPYIIKGLDGNNLWTIYEIEKKIN